MKAGSINVDINVSLFSFARLNGTLLFSVCGKQFRMAAQQLDMETSITSPNVVVLQPEEACASTRRIPVDTYVRYCGGPRFMISSELFHFKISCIKYICFH